MEITTEEPTKKYVLQKWHQPIPEDLEEMQQKYAVIKVGEKIESIDPQDVLAVLNRYAVDLDLDKYSIAAIFNLSSTGLTAMLKDKRFQQAWATAKKVRAERALQVGYDTASTPFDLLMQGKQISGLLVKAAALKSNYSMSYAKILDPELSPPKGGFVAGGDINVQVNSAIKVNDL